VCDCFSVESSTLPGQPGQPDIAALPGDIIIYSTLSMQRRADLYPPASDTFPDPALFSPDRWDHWTPKPWHFVPFNGGPRICIGQNFALTEMAFTRTFVHFPAPACIVSSVSCCSVACVCGRADGWLGSVGEIMRGHVADNWEMIAVVRLLQKYERVEYRGDWAAQFHKAEIVGCPGHGVPVAFFEPAA